MVQLRVATWNMDNWKQPADSREAAWRWLETEVAPDIALLQETIPPEGRGGVIWRKEGIDGNRPWGSAVVSFGPELREIRTASGPHNQREHDLHVTKPGCLAIAEVTVADKDPVPVVSMYGLIDDGYATTTVHRFLSDLTPLIDGRSGSRVVLGGDLNCSTQLPPPYREIHRNLFERFRVNGLTDLLETTKDQRAPLEDCPCAEPACGHVQTHRHAQSPKPWHNDYLFAGRELAGKRVSCEVVDHDDSPCAWDFSDHCPVVATFDL